MLAPSPSLEAADGKVPGAMAGLPGLPHYTPSPHQAHDLARLLAKAEIAIAIVCMYAHQKKSRASSEV